MKRLVKILFFVTAICLAVATFTACNGKEQKDFTTEHFTIEQAYAYAEGLGYEGTLEEFVAMLSGKDGVDGVGIATVAISADGHLLVTLTDEKVIDCGELPTVKGEKGDQGEKGDTGAIGNGIFSIEKTATNGLVDTYTITFTDGTTTTYTITNGESGEQGVGIFSMEKTRSNCTKDIYTVTYTDGDIDEIEVDNNGSGHVYGEWSEVIESTCSTYGIRVRLCKVCDESDFGVIEKKTHSWGTWKSFPATCTEDGLRERTCIDCGEKEQEIIPASGHDIIHHEGKGATCTEKGWKAYETCSRCDYTTYEEIDVLGHNVIDGECTRCHKHEYMIHVEYQYTDGTMASDTVEKTLWEGTTYEIFSPVIENYTADKTTVSGIADANKNIVVVYTRVSVERIVSIETVNLGNVEYNTSYRDLGLPGRLNGTTESGKTVSLEVYWNSSEYRPTTYGAQTISGLVVSAYGYAMDVNTAYATVNVLGNVITRINEMNLGKLPLGTDYEGLGLPTTAGVTTASGVIYYMPVTWNTYEYDKTIAGTHSINGTLTLESGFAFATGVENRATITFELSEKMYGTADIVFIVDTTGSMWDEIQNVKNNINRFAETLEAEGVSVRWALLEYRDITCDGNNSTKIIYCGSSEWYINVAEYEKAIASLRVSGGGDREETVIDALAAATYLDTRSGAKTFHIVVTDADYKVENNYGIANMTEMINVLKASEIVASTVTKTMYYDVYRPLTDGTGGILANIDGNFAIELWKLCDLITEEVVYGDVAYIEIISQPTKTVYNVGDYFDGTGMVVRAHYTSGSTRTVTGYSVTPCSTLQLSDTYVEINHRGKTANVAITVKVLSVPVTGVNVSTTSVTIAEGETTTVTATVMPTNATNKNVIWETMNPNVAVVTDGRITAIGAGTTTVRVTTADGRYTKTINVTVTAKAVPVTGIYVDKGALELNVGESATITATVLPANATNKTLVWTSTNTSVATVTNGVVTARSEGNATIKVTTVDGSYTAMSYVSVTIVEPSITMIYTFEQLVAARGNVRLGADINAGDNDVVYTNDVTLDLNGHNISFNDWGFEIRNNTLTINGNGGSITAGEACLYAQYAGKLVVNGGTYTSTNNFVIGTNASNGRGNNAITINGGTFNASMTADGQAAGYIACGIYVANNDTVVVNAGTFNITNGCGVLVRSGNTTVGADVVFNVTGDGTLGKVGDNRITIPTGEVLVWDFSANYPGGAPVLTNESDYEIYALVDDLTAMIAVQNVASAIILYGDITTNNTTAIRFATDMTLVLNNHSITSTNDVALRAVGTNAKLTIEGPGSVVAQEACVMAFDGAEIVINGGTFTAYDNFVVATSAFKESGNNTVTINAGIFNGNIQTTGYIACGVYTANNDVVVVNGGTFNITNGVGVLARSGYTTVEAGVVFNVTGDGTLGKIGDGIKTIPTGEVLVLDLASGYPGGMPTLVNNTEYEVYVIEGYTITFENWDGTVLQTLTNQAYHTTPVYTGATPTKEADAQYTYTFAGWSPAVEAVTDNAVYTATYTSTVNSYTITFALNNGSANVVAEYDYGTAMTGITPADPTKDANEQYTYEFIGWSPEVAETVVGEATYTAQYSSTLRSYTIRFLNWNGTVLQTQTKPYGGVPSYTNATPTKEASGQYTYTFDGWDPEPAVVTGNADYTAMYTAIVLDEEGTEGLIYTRHGSYYSVTGYEGTATEVVIPKRYEGKLVTELGRKAFENNTSITSVTIPDSVTSIGNSAFSGCSGLTGITIGDGVMSIGFLAFSRCSSLTNIVAGENNSVYHSDGNCLIQTAEKVLIAGCNSSVIPTDGTVASIGDYAFHGRSSLTSITIPDSVTSIGVSAFEDCSSLTSIAIGNGVTSIGSYAFSDCSSLTSITIPDSVTSIGSSAFSGCSSLTSITIPDSMTSIGDGAFFLCDGLTSIYYTGDIASWCGISFCGNFDSQPLYYAHNLYINNELVTEIVIPDTVTGIKNAAFDGWNGTSITIPDSVTSIENYAFHSCRSLTSVTIGNSVTSIGSSAFSGCIGLTSVYYTGDIASWCEITFGSVSSNPLWYAHNLYINNELQTEIVIPNTVTAIKDYAFCGWNGTSITIPDSVTSIGDGAFENCSSLTSITFTGTETQWDAIEKGANWDYGTGSYTVYFTGDETQQPDPENQTEGTSGLEYTSNGDGTCYVSGIGTCADDDIIIPAVSPDGDSVIAIGSMAFKETDITSVMIPVGVTSIDNMAFYGCESLETVTFPEGLTEIRNGAFSWCSNLSNATLPDSLVTVGDLFTGCISLESVRIPANVTVIGEGALTCCTGLETITVDDDNTVYYSAGNCIITIEENVLIVGCKNSVIPNTVEKIGIYAFYYCSDLTFIEIPDSVTSIDEGAFAGCDGLTDVVLANSIMSIGGHAFYGCENIVNVYYGGTEDDRIAITIGTDNDYFENANWYYYSFDYPAVFANDTYWHYVDGEIAVWEEEHEESQIWASVSIDRDMLYYGYEYLDPAVTVFDQEQEVASDEYTVEYKYYYENQEEVDGIPTESGYYTVKAIVTMNESGYVIYDEGSFELFECDGEFSYRIIEDDAYGIARYVGFATEVTVPSSYKNASVTNIDFPGFYDCNNVISIFIPDTVTRIASKAFYGCNALISISVDSDNLSYCSESGVLFNKNKTTIVCFPAGKSDETYTIPSSVTSIAENAFEGCGALTSLTIPDSVTKIGVGAFNDCDSLQFNTYGNADYLGNATNPYLVLVKATNKNITQCTMHADCKLIYAYAFEDCDGLTTFVVSDNVVSIGQFAFANCENLSSITIPVSTVLIDIFACAYCVCLRDVYYQGTMEQGMEVDMQPGWNARAGEITIHCTDGDITL